MNGYRVPRWQPDIDGYQYGVMFSDGSVHKPWNGRTQRARAEEYLASVLADQIKWCHGRRDPDVFWLVRRRFFEPWQIVDRPNGGEPDE